MSDAMYGFATGFAQGFSSTYTARLQAEAAEKRDKIRFGAQAWMEQEKRYNSAKAADQALMDQAEALVSSESLIPKDAVIDVFNMLKSGRSEAKIRDDVRTAGAKFELIPSPDSDSKPTDGTELVVPENDQTDSLLETGNTGLSSSASGDVNVNNPDEKPMVDTSSAPKKDDPNNPFTQYNTDIREAVGQEKGGYFDQVIAGYKPQNRPSKYKFVPGVTKTDIPTLQERLSVAVGKDPAYIKAVQDGDSEAEMTIVIEAIQASKKTPGDTLKFGTGGVAASMYAWANTEEGKNAITSGDGQAMAKQWSTYNDIINPDANSTLEFDMNKPEESFFNAWVSSLEGQEATKNGDGEAMAEALAKAEEQGKLIRDSINLAVGFDPELYTSLDKIPGGRDKYKAYPTIIDRLNTIAEQLKSQQDDSGSGGGKPYAVYSPSASINGKPLYVGMGIMKGGDLSIAGEVVDPQTASKYVLSSPDTPFDFSKISNNEFIKRQSTLDGSVDFAEAGAYYVATLQEQPLALTRVGRFASSFDEIIKEFEAAKQIASFQGMDPKDGVEKAMLDGTAFINAIENGEGGLSQFSAEVRKVMAQEAQLIFSIAKANGQTGNALSNKDFEFTFKSIFNSVDPGVVENNIKRLVGQKYRAAIRGAERIGSLNGMDLAIAGTGGAWWRDADTYAKNGLAAGTIAFIDDSKNLVESTVDKLITPQQRKASYDSGEPIIVDQAMVDAYPSLASKLGKTIQKGASE